MLVVVGLLLVTGWWDVLVAGSAAGSSPTSRRASDVPGAGRSPSPARGGRERTRPPPPAGRRRCARSSSARWAWRQLTSMRTALILLFLLALAAIPGSVVPQEAVDSLRASRWKAEHPQPDPDLRAARAVLRLRLGVVLRDLPAAGGLAGGLHRAPQRRLLAGVPRPAAAARHVTWAGCRDHRTYETDDAPDDVLERARTPGCARSATGSATPPAAGPWKRRVTRSRRSAATCARPATCSSTSRCWSCWSDSRSAVAVRVQGRRDRGDRRRLRQHPQPVRRLPRRAAASTPADLAPFDFNVDDFDVTFIREGREAGMAHEVRRRPDVPTAPGVGRRRQRKISVNHPLTIDGTEVFLIGHGYAPHITVRDGKGNVAFSGAGGVPARGQRVPSFGVVKVPDAEQATAPSSGCEGEFYPTYAFTDGERAVLGVPRRQEPGDLDARLPRRPRSRHRRAAVGLRAATRRASSRSRRPTASRCGSTSRWARARPARRARHGDVRRGQPLREAAGQREPRAARSRSRGVVLALIGLLGSLFIRPRRIWVRARREGGRTIVEVAGLDRSPAAVTSPASWTRSCGALRAPRSPARDARAVRDPQQPGRGRLRRACTSWPSWPSSRHVSGPRAAASRTGRRAVPGAARAASPSEAPSGRAAEPSQRTEMFGRIGARAHRVRGVGAPRRRWSPVASPPTRCACPGETCTSSR